MYNEIIKCFVTDSKKDDLFNLFKQQINVDLKKYHEPEFDKRGFVTIDIKRMPKTVWQSVNMFVAKNKNKIEMYDYGAWGKWMKLK